MDSDEHTAPRLHTFAPNPTIRLCPVCAPSPVFRPPSRATPAHLCAQPTIRLCPVCVPSPVFRPPSRPTSAHLRSHSYARAAPRLHTFARIPTHEPPRVCAPPPAFPGTSRATPAHFCAQPHDPALPRLRTPILFSTYFFNRFYVPFRQIIKRIYTNHLKYSYKSFKRVI